MNYVKLLTELGDAAKEQTTEQHAQLHYDLVGYITELENKLAYKQEQCDQLAHEVLELEQQLSRYQSKYNNLLAVAHRDGGHYLAQHGEEKAGEDAITAILIAYHSNDRYQGGVEVEGVWKQDGILFYPLPTVQLEFNQKVRVLVYPQADKGAVALKEVE